MEKFRFEIYYKEYELTNLKCKQNYEDINLFKTIVKSKDYIIFDNGVDVTKKYIT